MVLCQALRRQSWRTQWKLSPGRYTEENPPGTRSLRKLVRDFRTLKDMPNRDRYVDYWISADNMQNRTGKKKAKCKNCEGKGTIKKGDKVVRCQRCNGTGIKR
jgi:hypothetical protein